MEAGRTRPRVVSPCARRTGIRGRRAAPHHWSLTRPQIRARRLWQDRQGVAAVQTGGVDFRTISPCLLPTHSGHKLARAPFLDEAPITPSSDRHRRHCNRCWPHGSGAELHSRRNRRPRLAWLLEPRDLHRSNVRLPPIADVEAQPSPLGWPGGLGAIQAAGNGQDHIVDDRCECPNCAPERCHQQPTPYVLAL